jgi:histone deacetylase HOS2
MVQTTYYDPTFSDSAFFYDRHTSSLAQRKDGRLAVGSLLVLHGTALTSLTQDHFNRKVSYYHPKDVGLYHYGVSDVHGSHRNSH